MKIIIIQVVLHLMTLVMQWILLVNNANLEYGLIIPLLLHIMIMFGALISINRNHAKSLSKLITDFAPKEKQNV